MGATLDKPLVEKETERCAGNGLRVGASSMQGWRIDMEDQHTVLLGMPQLPDHSFIAVYDGHGGKQTAQIAGEKLLGYLQRQPSYLRYVQAAAPETLGEAMRTNAHRVPRARSRPAGVSGRCF